MKEFDGLVALITGVASGASFFGVRSLSASM
jgi:hypothetical protein